MVDIPGHKICFIFLGSGYGFPYRIRFVRGVGICTQEVVFFNMMREFLQGMRLAIPANRKRFSFKSFELTWISQHVFLEDIPCLIR